MAKPGSARFIPRAAAVWTGVLLVCLVGVFGILRFAEADRARDLRAWQDRLRLVADHHFAATNHWLASRYDRLHALSDNASLQIYLTEIVGAKGRDGALAQSTEAQRGYLYNLLLATAEREGFVTAPVGSDVAANVRRVGVSGLALLGPAGKVLVATPGMPPLEGRLNEALARVPVGERGLLDLYLNSAGHPTLGFVLPIFAVQSDPGPSKQVGRILGVREAGKEMLALLKASGLGEKSLETILVRRRGAVVEYLSPLLDGTGPIGKRLAFDTPDLAAAAMVAAPGGFAMLRDYRDIEVLVTARAISGTPWTMLTKVDRAEALAKSDIRANRHIIGFGLGMALLLMAFVAVWRHGSSRRAEAAAAKYRELARQVEQQKNFLRLVTDSQSDALYLVDEDNRYRFANQVAARAAGITADEMQGKTIASVFGPAAAARAETLNRHALDSGDIQSAIHRLVDGPDSVRIFQSVHVPLAATQDTGTGGTGTGGTGTGGMGTGGMAAGVLVVEKDLTTAILAREQHETTLKQLIAALVAIVDRRDPFAAHHSERVAELARAIAGEMALDEAEIETAETAGKLMNIGKILVPEALLTRQGPLNEDEKKRVQESMQASVDLLEGIAFVGPVTATLRQLQEHWDGTGLPAGLTGDGILLSARIVAAANAFVAMASPRAYRDGIGVDKAIANLHEGEGSLFDRRVVAALVNHLENHGGREHWGRIAKLAG